VARAKFPFPRKGWQAKPDGVGFQGNDYAEKKIKPWRYRQKSVELDKTCVFIKAAVLNMPFINFCRRHQSWIFLMKKASHLGGVRRNTPPLRGTPLGKRGILVAANNKQKGCRTVLDKDKKSAIKPGLYAGYRPGVL
jgi:hypothetical protein